MEKATKPKASKPVEEKVGREKRPPEKAPVHVTGEKKSAIENTASVKPGKVGKKKPEKEATAPQKPGKKAAPPKASGASGKTAKTPTIK